jgi:enoyl-CoA hydratase
MSEDAEILLERRGAAGLITLNRPKALNALTHGMVVAMHARLKEWAVDSSISCVVVQGEGERAFCAGGDIRTLYDSGRAGTPYAVEFYRDEYLLNACIKHYPKPYIALLRGFVMGGGSMLFAMPETGIGLFPDVGGSFFLPRLPGSIGLYLGLTGARLKTADALFAGIATHFIPAARREKLFEALANGTPVESAVRGLCDNPAASEFSEHRSVVDEMFAGASLEVVLAALDRDGSDWSRDAAKTIRTKSPTASKLAFRQIRTGKSMSFDDCMRMEFRMVNRVIAGHDFYEGVRATIIDKDGAPKWRPDVLADVADEDIDAYFAPLGNKELPL